MTSYFDFSHAPGHLLRRAHQLAVAEFARAVTEPAMTPVQFALLNAMMATPGADQISLAQQVAFDAATAGSVMVRLQAKGWAQRQPDPHDRRRKRLCVTEQGQQAVVALHDTVQQVQSRILHRLTAQEQQDFLRLLAKLVGQSAPDGCP